MGLVRIWVAMVPKRAQTQHSLTAQVPSTLLQIDLLSPSFEENGAYTWYFHIRVDLRDTPHYGICENLSMMTVVGEMSVHISFFKESVLLPFLVML